MIRSLLILILVTAVAWGARSFSPTGHVLGGTGASLGLGFLLIAGIQTGHIFHAARLPHLTGYLLCGLLFGPSVLGLLSHAMVNDLSLVRNVAVGLIALLAGCELNARVLRPQFRAIGLVTSVATFVAMALIFGLFFYVTGQLPGTRALSDIQRIAVAAVAATVLGAFSPSAVLGILAETKADGPFARLSLSTVVVNNLLIALLFSLANTAAIGVIPGSAAVGGLATLAWQILMSLAIGAVVGGVLGIYITRVGRRSGLVIFGVLFVVAESGVAVGLDPLLAGLAAGLFLENVTPVSGKEVVRQTEAATLPTFVVFFGVVGAELHLQEFIAVAPWALVAAAIRALGIVAGVRWSWRAAGMDEETAGRMPNAFLPQAGIALALAAIVENSFQPWGLEVAALLLGVVVVNEIAGPIMFRQALIRAGEVRS